jgi:hypothetical protein
VQYINVSDGGQAVIGDVERNKRLWTGLFFLTPIGNPGFRI